MNIDGAATVTANSLDAFSGDRLMSLDVLSRGTCSEHPLGYDDRFGGEGRELWVLATRLQWGDPWAEAAPLPQISREPYSHINDRKLVPTSCGRSFDANTVRTEAGRGGAEPLVGTPRP